MIDLVNTADNLIRYGIFMQLIKAEDGTQLEAPDPWLERKAEQATLELPR